MEKVLPFLPSFLGAALIVVIRLWGVRLRLPGHEEKLWVDVSAGVAAAYVFLDILPHLAAKQQKLLRATDGGLYGYLEHHAYLVALAGFLVYFGVSRFSERHDGPRSADVTTLRNAPPLVRFGAVSLAAYSFVIGYVLSEQPTHRPEPVILFALAMAVHFFGLDHVFRERQPGLYDRSFRWMANGALCAGWLLGVLTEVRDTTYALLFAFLGGGVIVVTMSYELPRVRSRRQYVAFCGGALGFAVLLLLIEFLRLE